MLVVVDDDDGVILLNEDFCNNTLMNVVKAVDEKADEKLSMIVQTANWKFTGERKKLNNVAFHCNCREQVCIFLFTEVCVPWTYMINKGKKLNSTCYDSFKKDNLSTCAATMAMNHSNLWSHIFQNQTTIHFRMTRFLIRNGVCITIKNQPYFFFLQKQSVKIVMKYFVHLD